MSHHDFGDLWNREPTFMEKHFWVIPVVMFSVFFIFAGIIFYCMYKHRNQLRWWRRPGVVVVQNNPGSSTTHFVGNYPMGSPMNPYYPEVVVQNAQPPSATHVASNYPGGTYMYPGVNNYPNVPPSYNEQNIGLIDNTRYPNTMQK